MTESARAKSFVEGIEEKRKYLFFTIVTVIVFAFLLNVFASIFVEIVFAGMGFSLVGAFTIGILGSLLFIAALELFELLAPPTVIGKDAVCTIFYNVKECEILDFPPDYEPQRLAYSAFESFGKKEENGNWVMENIAKLTLDRLDQHKHPFSQFLEYLVVYWLSSDPSWMPSWMVTGEVKKELEFEHFPNSLKGNIFLTFFSTLEPKDFFESNLDRSIEP
jgi:hypothetical protein